MKQLVKGIVFAAAALMLMQAPQAQAKVKVIMEVVSMLRLEKK